MDYGQVIVNVYGALSEAAHALIDHTGIPGVGGGGAPAAHAPSHESGGSDALAPFTGDSGAGGAVGYVPAPAAGDAAAGKFLKADGTWEVAGGGSGPVWTEVEIDLTNAELLALNSSPKTLIAAPGPGNVIDVLRTEIRLDNTAGLYVGGGPASIVLGGVTETFANAAAFTADAGVKLAGRTQALLYINGIVAMADAPLTLTNTSANFTGGNAANKATVNVIYRVVAVAPN